MRRKWFIALIFVLGSQIEPCQVHAQWGYGSYGMGYGGFGWGGWGATPEGDLARGLGSLYSGAGIYNQETAAANSINADTAIRLNEYLYESQLVSTRHYHQVKDARLAKDTSAYQAHLKRIQDNPTDREIQDGDALNGALDQLGDPRIHGSALRMATDPVDAQLIRDIPFRNASEAITITLNEFKNASKWPPALRADRFIEDHRNFQRLIDSAKKQDEVGDVDPETLDQLRQVMSSVKSKINAEPLSARDQRDANNFVKGILALIRMVEKPDVKVVLDELRTMKTTSIGNLLAFMHTFNLRFGPAETPKQRLAYERLFPLVDQARDRILNDLKPAPRPDQSRADAASIHDFFSGVDPKHLEPRKKIPPPPAPSSPGTDR